MPASPYSKSLLQPAVGGTALVDAGSQKVGEVVDYRFSREVRLLKPVEYKQVFDGGVRYVMRTLTLLARRNDLGYARLGLAISRKTLRRAVDRNSVKRQVRESFRYHQHEVEGLDIVVMARAAIKECNWQELRQSLDCKWQELHKRCKGC